MLARVPRFIRRLATNDEGTALTEFALSFGIYMSVVIATVQVAIWALTSSMATFAMWEGCRAGAAAYQPAPPDGTHDGGLAVGDVTDAEAASAAVFAATQRSEEVLTWLPVTDRFEDLAAFVEEDEIRPGEEGTRSINMYVRVRPIILFPLANELFKPTKPDAFALDRSCRLRLTRFYSY